MPRNFWIALSAGLSLLVALFLISPLAAVVPISFTPKRYLSMPAGDWSLRHYQELLVNAVWQEGILNSLLIGLATALVSTVLALLFSIGIWYIRSRFTRLLVGAVLVPMAVPPVISALTLYFFTIRANLLDSIPGTIIAHTVVAVPYAVVTLLVTLSQIDRRIELAARNLGASIWQTTFWVIIPNIRFGIASAALLSFILSWEELSVTLFVTSVEVTTLPKLIWSGLRDNIDPIIAAISVLLIVLTVAGMMLRLLAEGRKQGAS